MTYLIGLDSYVQSGNIKIVSVLGNFVIGFEPMMKIKLVVITAYNARIMTSVIGLDSYLQSGTDGGHGKMEDITPG
jgi:hypothetical protein